jgi:hypothetical protein
VALIASAAYGSWKHALGPTKSGYRFHVHQDTDELYVYAGGVPAAFPGSNQAFLYPTTAAVTVLVQDAKGKWVDGVAVSFEVPKGELQGQLSLSNGSDVTHNGRAKVIVAVTAEATSGGGNINVWVENVTHQVNFSVAPAPSLGF